MKKRMLYVSLFFVTFSVWAQQDLAWLYLRSKDSLSLPFEKEGDAIVYSGSDPVLKQVLDKYSIVQFKKTQRNAEKEYLYKTYFVRANSEKILDDLLENAPHVFVSGDIIPEEDKKIYEPNDYGLTSTIGENLGIQVNLDYLDFLGLPKAWYYTTGSKDIIIGISDGAIDTTYTDFKGKTKVKKKSTISSGHGYGVAGYAAAQGDNGFGTTGVCYDCGIVGTSVGDFIHLKQLEDLLKDNVKVINCSWGSTLNHESAQGAMNRIYNEGSLVIAASHNISFAKTKGNKPYYPASYDNVISVGTAMYKYQNVKDNIKIDKKGKYYAENIRGYLGRTVGFKDNNLDNEFKIWPASTANLNPEVDILAPSVGLFRLSRYVHKNSIEYIGNEATSPATPLVSGTVGLMFSLYPCLPVDEVESILKITSWNIDHIEVNRPFKGMYGAGILQTGDAVEMVYQLYNENETAYIKDQDFSRWNFKLTALSKELRIQDQKFREGATLKVKAKNKIVIGENTHLKPNAEGSIRLTIDPSLQKECELQLRDPSILEE